MTDCKHLDFTACVNVHVLEDIGAWRADVKIVCCQCGEPFEFVSELPVGVSCKAPTLSVDGTELSLPIKPVGTQTKKYPGFGVRCASDEPRVKGTA